MPIPFRADFATALQWRRLYLDQTPSAWRERSLPNLPPHRRTGGRFRGCVFATNGRAPGMEGAVQNSAARTEEPESRNWPRPPQHSGKFDGHCRSASAWRIRARRGRGMLKSSAEDSSCSGRHEAKAEHVTGGHHRHSVHAARLLQQVRVDPLAESLRLPGSPAVRNARISFSIRLSPIRWAIRAIKRSWFTRSK